MIQPTQKLPSPTWRVQIVRSRETQHAHQPDAIPAVERPRLQSGTQGRLAQLGEHQLDKLGDTGSSPVPPTLLRKIEIRREADFARVRPLKGRLRRPAADGAGVDADPRYPFTGRP